MKNYMPTRHLRNRRGHSAERLHNDNRFNNVRKNWNDFASAARAAVLLRNVMESIMEPVHDRERQWQLTKAMTRVIKSDLTHPKGQRSVTGGDLHLLQGVELNTGRSFAELFTAPMPGVSIDRSTGKLQLLLAPLLPKQHLASVTSATDFEIRLAGAEIDFTNQTFTRKWVSSGIMPLDEQQTGKMTLTVKMDRNSKLPWFLFMAVNYFNNGLKEKNNAIMIMKISPFSTPLPITAAQMTHPAPC